MAFGIALRRLQDAADAHASPTWSPSAFDALLVMLHWIIEVIPLAVFGIVASHRRHARASAVSWPWAGSSSRCCSRCCCRRRTTCCGSASARWVRPARVLRGMRDALVMAFSTASSTATMPRHLRLPARNGSACASDRPAWARWSGANFNNDGTALYEAMAALFVAQMLGQST